MMIHSLNFTPLMIQSEILNMDGKFPLKQRLARFFRASALLRKPCSSTAASSSTFSSSAGSSRLSVSTDIAVAPAFVPHETGINRSLSLPGRLDGSTIDNDKKKAIKKTKLLLNGYGFSSDSADEDDGHYGIAESFFMNSRSFSSSDSSGFYQQKKKKAKKKKLGRRRRRMCNGFAVTKRSRDPYADFCDSMADMVVEGQIFGAEGLESLLGSYLSLNSPHHHPVILRAFADVCGVLFGP